MTDRVDRLVDRSVADFVASVASPQPPVPAGASVAALTGATSAALLALVCSLIDKHHPRTVVEQLRRAMTLQQRLLALVDDDANAFRTFLASERGTAARREATEQVAAVPLEIGRTCNEVVELATQVHSHAPASLRQDVATARALAEAASRSALDIEQHNRVEQGAD